MIEILNSIDSGILLYIQEHIRTPFLTPMVTFLTSLGNTGIVWIVLSALLLIPKKTRKIGCISFLALLGSLIVNNMLLKNLVARTRPYEVIDGLTLLIPKPSDYSFPSGHAGCSFSSACVLYRRLPEKAGILAVLLAVLIGLSRLYVGVHYPSDVLAGMLTGIGISYAAEWVFEYTPFRQIC